MIAALYVQRDGIYYGLEGVDPWDEERDARNYDGPHPVVAHPPCARWCMLAPVNYARWGTPIGEDGGCFWHALDVVRRFGGVLEHPANSLAWPEYDLPMPVRGQWRQTFFDEGWVTEVSQSAYGHLARKRTWLYLIGDPIPMNWADPVGEMVVGAGIHSGQAAGRGRVDGSLASATPLSFRDVLIELARTSVGSRV